jgi:hypothetical protein
MTVLIVVRPAGRGRYSVQLDTGEILIASARTPVFDACRALLRRGMDPGTLLKARHAGSATIAYRVTVGDGAKLTVKETDRDGPRIVPWRPFPETR